MKKEYIYIGGTLLILIVIYLIIKKLKSRSTTKITQADRKEAIKALSDASLYNYNYTTVSASKLLDNVTLKKVCKKFKKLFNNAHYLTSEKSFALLGRLMDSDAQFYNHFIGYIKSKAILAQVAAFYQTVYQRDFATDLVFEVEIDKEFASKMKNYINSLPDE